MSEICPVCGKEFEVLWPSLWNYKRNNKLICSWKCIRKYDRGERDMSGKTKEGSQMITCRQMVEAMEAGADPMEWLKEKGYTNPAHAYQNMRNAAKAKDPELFARFPVKKKTREPAEEPVKQDDKNRTEEIRQHVKTEVVINEDALTIRKVEQEMDLEEALEITKGYKTTAINKDGVGEFYYDKRHGTIDWRNEYGEEVSLFPDDWRQLAEEIPKMLKILNA